MAAESIEAAIERQPVEHTDRRIVREYTLPRLRNRDKCETSLFLTVLDAHAADAAPGVAAGEHWIRRGVGARGWWYEQTLESVQR